MTGEEQGHRLVFKLPHRLHWADLLARTFEVDGFACPHCSDRMTIRAVVFPGTTAIDLTEALKAASRGPPQADRRLA